MACGPFLGWVPLWGLERASCQLEDSNLNQLPDVTRVYPVGIAAGLVSEWWGDLLPAFGAVVVELGVGHDVVASFSDAGHRLCSLELIVVGCFAKLGHSSRDSLGSLTACFSNFGRYVDGRNVRHTITGDGSLAFA